MPDSLETNTTVSHYRILRKLGVGGMGEVYLAEDVKLGRKVALKVLPPDIGLGQDRMRRFVQEAKAASSLNHPNIAHIYEIGESNGINFIAMEFVEGATLRERIHDEKLDLITVLKYLVQVADGLAKAHSAGIVHRDLKPDNIMISRDGYAKILDFGLSKLIEPQEHPTATGQGASEAATAILSQYSTPGMILGTPGYMSPEQARGQTNPIDHRSDIFSFGCILFEAVTGRRAFEGSDLIDTLNKTIREPVAPFTGFNQGASSELQRIVRRCLMKDPDERYQSIKDLAIELKELRHEQTTGEHVVNDIKRHKVSVVFALIVVTSAVTAFVAYRFTRAMTPAALHFQSIKLARLTAEGSVESVTVSSDGKYIAYSLEEGGKRSLWTKHLATSSRVQIVPPAEALSLNASTFSPDGSFVYYTKVDEQNPQGALYQVPVLGSSSKKILADVAQPISISPDGKRLAFQRLRRTGTFDDCFWQTWTALENAASSECTSPSGLLVELLPGRRMDNYSPPATATVRRWCWLQSLLPTGKSGP